MLFLTLFQLTTLLIIELPILCFLYQNNTFLPKLLFLINFLFLIFLPSICHFLLLFLLIFIQIFVLIQYLLPFSYTILVKIHSFFTESNSKIPRFKKDAYIFPFLRLFFQYIPLFFKFLNCFC
jgi:hypothetical protein